MRIKAKYSSLCPSCSEDISVGEEVFWLPGQKAKHLGCIGDLERIEEEEHETTEKLREIQERKRLALAEIQRKKEAERVNTLTISEDYSGRFKVSWEGQTLIPELADKIRAHTGGYVSSEGFLSDLAKKLKPFLDSLKDLERVRIIWEEQDGVEKLFGEQINAPDYDIRTSEEGSWIIVKPTLENWNHWNEPVVKDIPGSMPVATEKLYRVPISECWRLPKVIDHEVNTVVYDAKSEKIIQEEIERRAKLAEIAKKEDSDFLAEGLNGFDFRPFQRVGLEFGIVANGRILLCDDTGLGKTCQGIGIAEIAHRDQKDNGDDPFQTLCIVKSANIPNWQREIKRLTGIDALVCKTGMPSGQDIKKISIERYPWLLISYDTIGSKQYLDKEKKKKNEDDRGFYAWTSIFLSNPPNVVILDEAHMVKNPDTHRWKAIRSLNVAERIITMTASPILNRTTELWTSLHMVRPDIFPSYDQFVGRYTYDGRNPRDVDKLHDMISPFFLRRRKKDVLKDLPPINRVDRFFALSPRAAEIYERILEGIYIELEHFDVMGKGGEQKQVMHILSRILRLIQTCAADATDYTADLATEVGDSTEGKVLIFTRFKGTCATIAQKLGQDAVCTVKRTSSGFVSLSAQERDKLFEDARSDESVKYVVTTAAAQEGHNLEFCTSVIFNDLFWTPEAHRQCEGRAYGRISDPHPIDSYYVIADTEIVTWLRALLNEKMEIVEKVLEGVQEKVDFGDSVAKSLVKKVRDSMLKSKLGRKVS